MALALVIVAAPRSATSASLSEEFAIAKAASLKSCPNFPYNFKSPAMMTPEFANIAQNSLRHTIDLTRMCDEARSMGVVRHLTHIINEPKTTSFKGDLKYIELDVGISANGVCVVANVTLTCW